MPVKSPFGRKPLVRRTHARRAVRSPCGEPVGLAVAGGPLDDLLALERDGRGRDEDVALERRSVGPAQDSVVTDLDGGRDGRERNGQGRDADGLVDGAVPEDGAGRGCPQAVAGQQQRGALHPRVVEPCRGAPSPSRPAPRAPTRRRSAGRSRRRGAPGRPRRRPPSPSEAPRHEQDERRRPRARPRREPPAPRPRTRARREATVSGCWEACRVPRSARSARARHRRRSRATPGATTQSARGAPREIQAQSPIASSGSGRDQVALRDRAHEHGREQPDLERRAARCTRASTATNARKRGVAVASGEHPTREDRHRQHGDAEAEDGDVERVPGDLVETARRRGARLPDRRVRAEQAP